jgi:hypothetical protein
MHLQDNGQRQLLEDTFHTAEDRFYAVRPPEEQRGPDRIYAVSPPEELRRPHSDVDDAYNEVWASRDDRQGYLGRPDAKNDRIGPAYWETDRYDDDIYGAPYDTSRNYIDYNRKWDSGYQESPGGGGYFSRKKIGSSPSANRWDDPHSATSKTGSSSDRWGDPHSATSKTGSSSDRWGDPHSVTPKNYGKYDLPLGIRYDHTLAYDEPYGSYGDHVDELDSSNTIDRQDRPGSAGEGRDPGFSGVPGYSSLLTATLGVRGEQEEGTTRKKGESALEARRGTPYSNFLLFQV